MSLCLNTTNLYLTHKQITHSNERQNRKTTSTADVGQDMDFLSDTSQEKLITAMKPPHGERADANYNQQNTQNTPFSHQPAIL